MKSVVRTRVLNGEPRIDGREKDMVRALDVRTGVLPRTHGSSLFTRGETQALVTATLGTARDAQTLDQVMGEVTDTFLFHYNFLRTAWVKPVWSVHRNAVKSATAVWRNVVCWQ